jgi:hypothetical protein
MKKKLTPIKASEVIGLVPDELLDKLASDTKVDYSVQKLHGKVIFKLFLFTFLNSRKISLRILEEIFKSQKFKSMFKVKASSIKHSALGMRLQSIDYQYFQKIFEYLITSPKLEAVFFADQKILARKIDSTMVSISAKLLKFGMENKNGNKKNLKYSLELTAGIPVNLMLFTDQKSFSEDIALPELIKLKPSNSKVNIAIFDRGIQNKKTFTSLVRNQIYFISRTNTHKYRVVEDLPLKDKTTASLIILSDQIIQFEKHKTGTRMVTLPEKIRLVRGRNKETQEVISFITNVDFLAASEVTELYKSRWEIEAFFKFIKQELNFSHILSRTENGIKVVMYLTMITAILLTLYKKLNRITGWAVTKIRFMDELESEIMENWHAEIAQLFTTGALSNLNSS